MPNAVDLTGKRFNRLTVLACEGHIGAKLRWRCLCDCGRTVIVSGSNIARGNTKSCGCLRKAAEDLVGQKFGMLTVEAKAQGHRRGIGWSCRCDCGASKVIMGADLRAGTKSCGCLGDKHREEFGGHNAVDLAGRRFGRLVATHRENSSYPVRWCCTCDCGETTTVVTANLIGGSKTRSCGCLARDITVARSRTHGMSRTPTYNVWRGVLARCCSPESIGWPRYGGRGITVCDRWRCSFDAFLADMGPRPSSRHSIDRINNDGNYEPGNCRWATMTTQQRNRGNNRMITVNGETLCSVEWADRYGIEHGTLLARLRKMPPEQAVTMPLRRARTR